MAFIKKSVGRYSHEIYTIEEVAGLGYYVEGKTQKLFSWQFKLVKKSEHHVNIVTRSSPRNILELRQETAKQKTIERRLGKYLG